ncbi:signal peptidase I [Sutcliffiella horikoshii]|uniref:signal peptidase I n=1 Tax=Sutcliffiella horikoshii TaxID=79883 RepID=UPI0021F5CEDB|nr:signal peptidase I [Sutcliffiella horikoshii]
MIIVPLLILAATYCLNNIKVAVVLSDSMRPTFSTGDLIISKLISSEEVNIGDVISYGKNKEVPITHRVMKIEKNSFTTKGDSVSIDNTENVEKSTIISKYVFRVPYAGYIINWISSPWGFLLFYVIPINYICYTIIKRIIYSRKSHKRYMPQVF